MQASALESIIQQIVESHELPGAAVGIVEDNEIVYANGFGVKRLGADEPITPTSLFHMASVSKPFVATAIMQLVEQGQVGLDIPVSAYLPYFQVDDARYKGITVQQMLSHVSGMPDVTDYQWDRPEYDDGALERYVRSLTHETLLFAPGERFSYSNMAYEVLGDVIAKVSGRSFEDYEKDHILNPLEMVESTFLKQQAAPELLTTPHVRTLGTAVSDVYPYHRAHAPSSTLHSNALEMCNWAIANLNRGAFKDRRILERSSYEMLWRPHAETKREGFATFVGLSWFIGEYKGHRTIGHGGGDVGYRTNFVMLPERGTGVVVLTNSWPAPVAAITEVALDVMLGLEPQTPKVEVTVPMGRVLGETGLQAAIDLYHELKENQFNAYDFGPEQFFHFCYSLIAMQKATEAIEILKLSLEAHPEFSLLYTLLAKAYMDSGERELALENLHKSLELDPDNTHAAGMMKEIVDENG